MIAYFILVPALGILALLFTYIRSVWISHQDPGNEKMQKISGFIARGAMAFLKAEYSVIAIFVVIVAILLMIQGSTATDSSFLVGVSFIVGAVFSASAGFIGMRVATKANVRTTAAARHSLNSALLVAFNGGSVMGMGVVGLGVLGLGLLLLIYASLFGLFDNMDNIHIVNTVITVITGFSFGASSIALFARVGGGIYTKAADVGADLVGKVEAGIPEDHHLNPATIADNVGDNVGDVAGMGADLFESYVGSIVSSMVLGATFLAIPEFEATPFKGFSAVMLPLFLAGVGIIFSIVGTFFVRVKEGGNPQSALNVGTFVAAILTVIGSYFVINWLLPSQWVFNDPLYGTTSTITSNGVFFA
ncbi:MAG: sodium/proton-translocating pyrophosphatase, partial [Candidatus Kapaibacteriota bacterium]